MDAVRLLKEKEVLLRERFGVASIGVFGSFARGEEGQGSDVDVLVEFSPGRKTFDNFMDLKFYLEGLFGREVDLVTVQALKPAIKDEVLQSTVYA